MPMYLIPKDEVPGAPIDNPDEERKADEDHLPPSQRSGAGETAQLGERLEEIKAKGVDAVCCTAVNDVFVMDQWGKDTGAAGQIELLSDGAAEFAKATGLNIDLSGFGLGVRSKRYAMLVDDGVVKVLNIDEAPPQHDKSSAATLCSAMGNMI